MPGNDSRRPEDWYRYTTRFTSSPADEFRQWYSRPGSSELGYFTPSADRRPAPPLTDAQKKHRRTKIISLCVCGCVVLCAAVFGFWRFLNTHVQVRTASVAVPAMPGIYDAGTDEYESYHDYFANTYTGSNAVSIPQAPLGSGVKMRMETQAGPELSLQDIYDRVSPAVVGITTYKDGEKYSWGTGVVFTSNGYIVTNTHILEGSEAVTVAFSDGEPRSALLVGADGVSDIAVLKLDGQGYPHASFVTSDSLRVGDEVVAIGNPLGEDYSGTMTNGIISAIDRNVIYNGHTMTLLQTNAALNEGNSGGPLVNTAGQVVGITNMKIMSVFYSSVEGIGFAIPSNVVKQIADQLLAQGAVPGEPTIGITAAPVSQEAQIRFGLPGGVYVAEVSDGSDAKDRGLQVGDIILEVNGTAVASVADVNAIKDGLRVGDSLALKVYRDGETFDMTIFLVDKMDIE